MNIQYKETVIDEFIRSTEGLMKHASFFLPVETQLPLIDITKRRNICGWEVVNLPSLFFKASKDGVTVRYYYCTKEWVVNFDDSNKQHEFDDGFIAKQKVRKYLNEHTTKPSND